MKKNVKIWSWILLISFSLISSNSFAEPISKEHARKAAERFLSIQKSLPVKKAAPMGKLMHYVKKVSPGLAIKSVKEIRGSDCQILAYIPNPPPNLSDVIFMAFWHNFKNF